MSEPAQSAEPFKQCTLCGKVWPARDDFLSEPTIELAGYQAFLPDPVLGLFLFNHQSCGTTLALKAEEFRDLYDGPVYTERKTHTEECMGYCDTEDELRPCPQECECAWVREILHIVKGWPKAS